MPDHSGTFSKLSDNSQYVYSTVQRHMGLMVHVVTVTILLQLQ